MSETTVARFEGGRQDDTPKARRLWKLLTLVDPSGKGLIDFHDFLTLDFLLSRPGAEVEVLRLSVSPNPNPNPDSKLMLIVKVAFRLIDLDRSGSVSGLELRRLWETLMGPGVRPPQRVEELLEGGQEVGLEEFRVLIEAELPEMFRREVESLVEQWGSIELAATHDARWPSPAAP